MVAALLSFLCKKLDSSEIDDEQKLLNATAAEDEELWETSEGISRPKTRQKVKTRAIDPFKLSLLRERKINEKKMTEVLKDIGLYFFFLILLLSLSGQNRNINAFRMNTHFKTVYDEKGSFSQVSLNII